jgi:hypothetical protein
MNETSWDVSIYMGTEVGVRLSSGGVSQIQYTNKKFRLLVLQWFQGKFEPPLTNSRDFC